jgi:hypothetical protein
MDAGGHRGSRLGHLCPLVVVALRTDNAVSQRRAPFGVRAAPFGAPLPVDQEVTMPTMSNPTGATGRKATAKKSAAKKVVAKKAPAKAAKASARTTIETFDPTNTTTHVCITCGERKPISRFYKRPSGLRNSFCKICGRLARGVITPAEAKVKREREQNGATTAKKAPATAKKAAARRR